MTGVAPFASEKPAGVRVPIPAVTHWQAEKCLLWYNDELQ